MGKRKVVERDGYRYIYDGDKLVSTYKINQRTRSDNAPKPTTQMTQAEKDARAGSKETAVIYNKPKVQSNEEAQKRAEARKNYSGNDNAMNQREREARKSSKEFDTYLKDKALKKTRAYEQDMRDSSRELESFRKKRREYELAYNKRIGKSDKVASLLSDVYKRERGKEFDVDNYHTDFVNLLNEYQAISSRFGKEYVSPDEIGSLSKKVDDFAKRANLANDYATIYGEDMSPMLHSMYNAIGKEMDTIKQYTDFAKNDYAKYDSAEHYNISKINNYGDLINLRKQYEQMAISGTPEERIKAEKLLKLIDDKISTAQIAMTMTPDDIESEKKRFSESVYNTMQPGRNVSYTPEGYMYYDYGKVEKEIDKENSAKAISDKFDDAVKESEALRLINDYTNRTDFESSRSAVSPKYTQDNGAALPNTSENEAKLIYNAVNGDSESIGMLRDTEAILGGRRTNMDFSVISTMTSNEIDTYNYIVNTQGLEAGSEFIKKLSGVLNKRKSDELSAEAYKYAQEHPFLSLISGVLSAPISAIGDLTTTVSDIYNGATGKGIDIYDERHRGQNISSAMSQGGQSAFESPIAQFLYGTAESGGKEAMLYATTLGIGKAFNLGGKALSAINMAAHSGSAFEGKLIQYKEEGYSDASALIAGLVSAGIEAATEALPMDRLLKTPDVLSSMNTKKIVQIMKRAGVSGIEEGLEEGASMILGDIYDIATNHEKLTAYYQAYNKAIKEGKSEKEATVQGFLSAIGELGQNVLAGAFVGMGMSASNSASVVIRSDKVRSIAENYFRDNGSEDMNVAILLTQFGMPADTETLNTAKNLIGLVNGKLISPELRDSINNTPELRGVVQALANIKAEGGFDTEEVVEDTEPVETPAPTDTKDKPSDLFTTLTSGKLSSNQIDGIIGNPDQRQEFQELTGITLEGSKAKQRNIMQEWIRDRLNIDNSDDNLTDDSSGVVSEKNATGETETIITENTESANIEEDLQREYEASVAISEINTDNVEETIGRNGGKAYSNAVNSGEVMNILKNQGMSDSEAKVRFDEMFNFMYESGRKGYNLDVSLDAVELYIAKGVRAQAMGFYYAGQNDSPRNLLRGKKNAKLIRNNTLKLMRSGKLSGRQISERTFRAINNLAKLLGVDIEFVNTVTDDKGKEVNAKFNTKTGRLQINKNSKTPFFTAAVHESIHAIRTIAPEGYNSMSRVVFDVLNYSHPAAREILSTYASDYKAVAQGKITLDTINEEIVAKVVSELLTDEDFVRELAIQNRNLLQRIYDHIIDFLQRKINELWQTDLTPAMKDAIDMLDKDFGKIKSLYETALKSTQNLQTDKGKASEVGGEMYSKSRLTSDKDSGKINKNGEQYQVMWTIEEGIMDKRDVANFYTQIANFRKRGHKNYHVSQDGEYIFAVNNKLVYTDGDYMYPEITKVISFKSDNQTLLNYGRSLIYNYEKYGIEIGQAIEIAEITFGEGNVTQSKIENSRAFQREISGRTGKNSRTSNSRSGEDVELYSKSPTPEELHIDNRTFENVGSRSVKAFQFLHPEVKAYYEPIVRELENDLQNTTKGERIMISDSEGGDYGSDPLWLGTKRFTSEAIAKIKDDTGATYDAISAALDALLEGNGAENNALSKRIELVVDEMLTDGYTDFEGRKIPADDEYIALKKSISENAIAQELPEIIMNTPVPSLWEGVEMRKAFSEQIKEEARKKINAYVEKYGELEKGAMPARNVTLPKKTSEKRYVRRNTRTIAEAEAITDENAAVLIEEVANDAGWTTYERFGDKQAIDAAVTEFERIGYDAALAKWRAVYASNKRISKQDIADVHLLIQEASKRGDKKTFVELVSNSAEIGTMSGQVVQAMFLIKRLGPAAQITALEKNIANAEEEINKKHHRSDFKFDVPQELIDEYNEALLEEEKEKREAEKEGREIDKAKKKKSDKILDRIYEHMSRQVPKTWADRITTWRYFAMLGNPRTHIRNIAGNAVFMPVVMTKHVVAALGEDGVGLIASVAGRNMERTKSIRGIATMGKHWKFAGQDAKDIEDVLRGEAKYGEHKKSKIQPKPFKLAEWNNKALGFEDWVFLKPHYQIALSMYLSTNKLNPETMSIAELDKARTYAIKEAQKATFRETSDLVDALSAIKHKGLRFVIDAVLPFKKTPVNILKRGVEYSPAGLLWQLKKGLVDLRKGKINASEFIDGLASGTTGTGLLILGVFFAAKGALNGGSDDDEKEINELLGIQDYSLTIGGVNFTIDWLAPSAMPLFVGCELYKAYQTNKEKGQPWHYMFSDFADILPAITEPLFEMSMLEGLSNIVEAGAYEETTAGKLSSIAIGIPTSYLGQFVPTLLGQIARTADNTQRQTYADKNNAIPDIVERFAIQQAKKIPGLSNLLAPAIDKKGQPRTNSEGENIFTRALENFFSPAYINKIKSSTIDEEIQRLYDSMGEGARSVIPKSLDRYITVNGEKKDLTAKEYTKLQSTFGQTYYSKLKEIIGTDYYNNLSDENKVKLIGKAKEYSTEKAKSESDTRYRVDGWLKSAFETPGVYQYIIDTDTAEGFSEDDISDANKESYEIGRSTTWDSVLKYFNPDGSDYDFADKYYDNLNIFAKTLNVDKYSDGKFEYSSSNKWVSTIKDWNAKEQAEYIYGRTLRSQYDDQDEANQALQNDRFITDRPRMYLLKDSFGADKSPGTLYNKYLKDSSADEITWGNLWEKYNNTPTEINGKKNDRKKIMVAEINKLRISNEQKSRMYYALGYGTSDKGLKGVPWAFVRIPEFEKESE